jgi:hypothetical protein
VGDIRTACQEEVRRREDAHLEALAATAPKQIERAFVPMSPEEAKAFIVDLKRRVAESIASSAKS